MNDIRYLETLEPVEYPGRPSQPEKRFDVRRFPTIVIASDTLGVTVSDGAYATFVPWSQVKFVARQSVPAKAGKT